MAEACDKLTGSFPRDEPFGMSSQIRQPAAPLAANIAAGHGREHAGPFVQVLRRGPGSRKETEARLPLSPRVGLASQASIGGPVRRCDDLGTMLRALVGPLQRSVTAEQN